MPALTDLIRSANDWLSLDTIADYPGALNGLQLENSGQVTKIAAAVDAWRVSRQRVCSCVQVQSQYLDPEYRCNVFLLLWP